MPFGPYRSEGRLERMRKELEKQGQNKTEWEAKQKKIQFYGRLYCYKQSLFSFVFL